MSKTKNIKPQTYPVKVSNLEHNKSISSSVLSILTLDCDLNAFSSDQIAALKANDNAKYCTSLSCGDNFSASSAYLLNSLNGINSISLFTNLNTFPSSSRGRLLLSIISSRCLPTSKNRNSGDIKSNSFTTLFNKNTAKALLFENNAENTLLASTTKYIKNQLLSECLNLCDNDLSTFSDSSKTSFSVSLLLETMPFNSSSLSSFCLINFLTTNGQFTLNSSISCLSSSGISTFSSAIFLSQIGKEHYSYLNLSFKNGSVGIGNTIPNVTLHVSGVGNFSGNLFAGSCTGAPGLLCTDIAELFPTEDAPKAADVVCLNENGKADYCDKAYDNKILGVISTNPAIVIEGGSVLLGRGNYTQDTLLIALKGKVPVKVICNTPISQGDLLVSANKKGYAMKKDLSKYSIEEKIEKLEGTTLGKALEECKSGESMIMAWVG